MTKHYDEKVPYIQADAGKVLCDGATKTSVGGCVLSVNTAILDTWQEMTEAEADALIAETEAEATEEDYQAALGELGVDLNEEV